MSNRKFRIALIKPSHYDDDGYVIQWRRSTIPSNSLASVYGLLVQCAEEGALGPETAIEIEAYDECNTVIDIAGVSSRILSDGSGMVALVGVQTNQFPRALDIARQFRERGITVAIGGFHVSGCIAMLPELPPDLKEAQALGIILYAGEGEDRLAEFLRDVDSGEAKPVYNYLNDMPDMAAAAIPVLPREVVTRVAGHYTSFDAGRGCPFQCSFCTIINVQGRKSRYRTADDVEAIVRANAAQGVTRFFVTDDNFARNRNWEPILDRLIELREQGFRIRLLLQVDTLCHRIPHFIDKAARAGCNAVFIGLENINPESLMGAKKRQNKIWEYRDMLRAWKRAGVMTWAGYILGFPTDTPESIARDIETIKRELPIDILEFFFLTPLPGSEDHKVLHLKGARMEPDMNNYFVAVAAKWAALALRYRKIYRRVVADKDAAYVDEALRASTEADRNADFVAAFADKIPDTYGGQSGRPPPRLSENVPPWAWVERCGSEEPCFRFLRMHRPMGKKCGPVRGADFSLLRGKNREHRGGFRLDSSLTILPINGLRKTACAPDMKLQGRQQATYQGNNSAVTGKEQVAEQGKSAIGSRTLMSALPQAFVCGFSA